MAKAGFCEGCNKNVWLNEDGGCINGHPASVVKDIYEIKPPKKRRTWLIVLSIIVVVLLLLFGCIGAIGFFYWRSLNVEPKKDWTKVEGTDFYYKQDKNGRMYFEIPKREWLFSVNLKGFRIMSDGGSWPTRMIYARDPKTGVFISIFAEPAFEEGDAEVCREYYWKKQTSGEFKYEDVKFWEKGDFACVDSMLKKHQGTEANQKNIHLYIVKDGVWFDVHLSKGLYESQDKKEFD